MIQLFQVTTASACGGVLVDDGLVVGSAPIFKWMRGKSWDQGARWSKIEEVTPCDDSQLDRVRERLQQIVSARTAGSAHGASTSPESSEKSVVQ